MVTISLVFALLAGIIATFAIAKNNSLSVQSISYLILGIIGIELVAVEFSFENENNFLIPGLLWVTVIVHFIIGEFTKNKIGLAWNILPLIFATSTLFLFDLSGYAYNGYELEGNTEFFLIAFISALTPFLTHLAKLGIGILVIQFGKINWAENEENYLESLVSYAFIGGVAALGNFLLGGMGLVVAAIFYLSASFIARNKLGLKNDIILAASGAMILLVIVPRLLKEGGFESLNFLRGEVIEGAFVAGFMIIIYELFMKLARFNQGKWRLLFTLIALLLPITAILVLGFAYLAFERLGGILALGGMVTAMALISILFTLFKNSSFINLKLITVGLIFIISPYIKPIEQISNIDLVELGISIKEIDDDAISKESKKEMEDFKIAVGQWQIDEESSKVYFELGPDDGRTKGEFKSISGTLKIDDEPTNSKINVLLKVKDLTTFITPRDQELMGKGYFNEEKYPEIYFVSKSVEMERNEMLISGDFTMMGVTKKLEVKMQLIGKGEQNGKAVIVLYGQSEIDRTEFGQSPSSKIGNVVEFEFEIQAIEK
jgi:polyisoprenoid-binding protein YceI